MIASTLHLIDIMKTIVVTSPKTIVSVDQTHFTLRSAGKKIGRIPPTMVSHIVVGAEVEVSRKALTRMVDTGVGVTFLDNQGRSRSRLLPPWKNTPEVRIGQIECAREPNRRMAVCRKLVEAKINCQLHILTRARSNRTSTKLAHAIAQLSEALIRLKTMQTPNEAMGIEGWAAKEYWAAFGELLNPVWLNWNGRNRRPPKDPANAALSYGYAILLNRVLCLLEAAGMDTYVGCLHETSGRHPSFALDVMEPFRPALVDRTVIRLFNRSQLCAHHFESDRFNLTVHLNKEGRLLLLDELDKSLRCCDTDLYNTAVSINQAVDNTVHSLRSNAMQYQMEAFEVNAPLN